MAWICIDTSFLDHPIVGPSRRRKGGFSREAAWIWLIAKAAFKTHTVGFPGGTIEVRRGQCLAGREYLAKEWGWTVAKVRTWLGILVENGMVEINQPHARAPNVISICNYAKYQREQKETRQPDNQLIASKSPHSNKDTQIDNNPPSPHRGGDDFGVSASAPNASPYRNRDPFRLNADADPERVGIRYNEEGNLEAFNGTKVQMLQMVGGDEDQLRLDLLVVQGTNKVGPSMHPMMLKSKAIGALAEVIGRRRDSDRRYQQAAANNQRGATRRPSTKTPVDDLPPTKDESEICRRFEIVAAMPKGQQAIAEHGRDAMFSIFRRKQLERAGVQT